MNRWLAAFVALWISSSLAGPIHLVKDINRTVSLPSDPSVQPVAFGSRWLLTLCHDNGLLGTQPNALCDAWISDGTASGSHALTHNTELLNRIAGFAVQGDTAWILFLGTAPVLMRTDGTAAGTTAVKSFGYLNYPGPGPTIAATDNYVFFVGPGGALWRTDSTGANTLQLTPSAVSSLIALGNSVYFIATDPSYGAELFVSDGSVAGTHVLKDIDPGPGSSNITGMDRVGDRIVFQARDSDFAAPTLWSTDGTEAGTVEIASISPNTYTSFAKLGSTAYFLTSGTSADPYIVGLWRTDGTPAGTALVRQWSNQMLAPGPVAAGGYVYFSLYGSLWRSDGTADGTVQVPPPSAYAPIGPMVAAGSDLYYRQLDDVAQTTSLRRIAAGSLTPEVLVPQTPAVPWGALGDQVLMRTDHVTWTFDGVGALQTFEPPPEEPTNSSVCPTIPAVLGDQVFFAANDGPHGCEPWVSDGTTEGTRMIVDTIPGEEASGVRGQFVRAGPYVYFDVSAASGQDQVWRTDGTVAGTAKVYDGFSIMSMVACGDSLVLVDYLRMLRIDALSGTATVVPIPAGWDISWGSLASAGGSVYFTLWNNGVYTLARYDGSSGAVTVLNDPTSLRSGIDVGGALVYFAQDNSSRTSVRRIDSASTTPVVLVQGTTYASTANLAPPVNGRTYFALDGKLYRTDGTVSGTAPVAGSSPLWIDPAFASDGTTVWMRNQYDGALYVARAGQLPALAGSQQSMRFDAAVAGGTLFYPSTTPDVGLQLWMNSGTSGAVLADDLVPDLNFGSAPWLAPVALSRHVVLMAIHGDAGFEPYALDFDTTPDPMTIPQATNVATAATVISSPIAIAGINVGAPVTVTDGQFCVSSGANCSCDLQPFATSGSVDFGQYICVRQQSSSALGTSVTTLLNIGGVSTSFTSTTVLPQTLSIAMQGSGAGSIAVTPGTSCASPSCTQQVIYGTTVRLTAMRTPGSAFSGWSGDCSGTADCVINMTRDMNVIATFDPAPIARVPHDLDHDGRSDLVWRGTGGAQGVWIMNGADVSSAAGVSGGAGYAIKVVADFDGDGRDDLLYRGADGSYKIQLLNAGAVVGEKVILAGGTGWEVMAKGDFNGDGKTDLLWKSSSGVYGMWLMDGTNVLGAGLFQSPGPGWDVQLIADFGGDGKSDILWRNSDGRIQEWAMDGANSTGQVTMTSYQNQWMPLFAGDFDGDGKADIVWSYPDGSIAVWLVDGTTVRSATVLSGANTGWHVKLVGDLDGDGKSDIVLEHANGAVGAWLMNGSTIASAGQLLAPLTGWSVVSSGDFNGDGRADLVWRSNSGGAYGLWLMDGLTTISSAQILAGGTGWEIVAP